MTRNPLVASLTVSAQKLLEWGTDICDIIYTYIHARHILGKRNEIADSVSRFQLQQFRELAPHADLSPCQLLSIWTGIFSIRDQSVHCFTHDWSNILGRRKTFYWVRNPCRSKIKQQCLPASEHLLTEFVAYLAKSIKYVSIKTYLVAVRHFHWCSSFQLNLQKMEKLHLVLRGIRRSHGDQSRERLPIIPFTVWDFFTMLPIPSTSNFELLILWAAMTLALFGFLRLGELTCKL